MIQSLVVKLLFKQIMKAIEKTSDKRIASGHHKRIKALEKNSHPPIFTLKDKEDMVKRLKKLEGKK